MAANASTRVTGYWPRRNSLSSWSSVVRSTSAAVVALAGVLGVFHLWSRAFISGTVSYGGAHRAVAGQAARGSGRQAAGKLLRRGGHCVMPCSRSSLISERASAAGRWIKQGCTLRTPSWLAERRDGETQLVQGWHVPRRPRCRADRPRRRPE